ncbi:uncharacterized protein [Linepithema humile]|uniref:uncharacterized protein n=1 Tax=Linepithema humile TaxID=83485 RepID=UPI0006237D41|nr:PREDICTED: uncharacterized protein LOC105667550 [Linepithema humile]
MLVKILVFTFVITYVTAAIPSYIHVCGRKDPNIDKCVVNSIDYLRSKICEGIPEMNVTPLRLFHVSKLIISETDNIKLYLKDMQILNLCNFVINDFHIDLDKKYFDIQILFKDIFVNATYDFDIRVLVPITTTGYLSLSAEYVDADADGEIKIVKKNDKKHIYVSKLTINLIPKNFNFKFENNESDQMQEIIANFIGSNKQEVLATIKPPIEKALSETIISMANNIVKHFTYDELLPDRT